jgi:hypothetical protein
MGFIEDRTGYRQPKPSIGGEEGEEEVLPHLMLSSAASSLLILLAYVARRL